jgi:hypothetical protein
VLAFLILLKIPNYFEDQVDIKLLSTGMPLQNPILKNIKYDRESGDPSSIWEMFFTTDVN